jgi:hypothetical protein
MENGQYVALVNRGVELAPQPVVTVRDGRGGEVEFIFQPNAKAYHRVDTLLQEPARIRTVSNAEALAQVVVEEARRRGNKDGNQMTVIFDGQGGTFHPDDNNRDNPDRWDFERKTSKQLKTLAHVIDKPFDHADLLRAMSSLRFMIPDFPQVYSAMRRVRIDKKAQFVSQPQIINGANAQEFNLSFTIEGQEGGGAAKVVFPSEFVCSLPLISMSSVSYCIPVEIDSWVAEKSLKFALRAPGIAAQQDQAILQEILAFESAIREKLPLILIVSNL